MRLSENQKQTIAQSLRDGKSIRAITASVHKRTVLLAKQKNHTYTGVFTSNNGPNIVPTQPNKHISQTSRYQLIFIFFYECKTAFIKTVSSYRYVTSIKPKMYLFK
jgi:hypothetical protein